jgi:hypothetical protein
LPPCAPIAFSYALHRIRPPTPCRPPSTLRPRTTTDVPARLTIAPPDGIAPKRPAVLRFGAAGRSIRLRRHEHRVGEARRCSSVDKHQRHSAPATRTPTARRRALLQQSVDSKAMAAWSWRQGRGGACGQRPWTCAGPGQPWWEGPSAVMERAAALAGSGQPWCWDRAPWWTEPLR